MADYYFLLDAAFETVIRPALAACCRRRSFEPCRAVCEELLPAAQAYRARYHAGDYNRHGAFIDVRIASDAYDRRVIILLH